MRLSIEWPQLERAAAGNWTLLDERVDALRRRSIPVLMAVGAKQPGISVETWALAVREIAMHLRGRVIAYQIESALEDAREYAFALKLAAVQLKAIDPNILVAQATVGSDRAGVAPDGLRGTHRRLHGHRRHHGRIRGSSAARRAHRRQRSDGNSPARQRRSGPFARCRLTVCCAPISI